MPCKSMFFLVSAFVVDVWQVKYKSIERQHCAVDWLLIVKINQPQRLKDLIADTVGRGVRQAVAFVRRCSPSLGRRRYATGRCMVQLRS